MKIQISHNPTDGPFVDRLSDRLGEIGVEPCRDYLKKPGTARGASLDRELRKYDFMLIVLSPAYWTDKWLGTELIEGIHREKITGQPFIIPVLAKQCDVPAWLPRAPIDFTTSDFDSAFDLLAANLVRQRQAFIVMKLRDKALDQAYELAIKPVLSEFGIKALRIDQVEDSGTITDQILREIERSEFVLADLTGERPNCYFEAGYAHALGKEMILTIKSGETIHFDMAARRFIVWDTEIDLRDALRQRLSALKELADPAAAT